MQDSRWGLARAEQQNPFLDLLATIIPAYLLTFIHSLPLTLNFSCELLLNYTEILHWSVFLITFKLFLLSYSLIFETELFFFFSCLLCCAY